MRMPLEALHAHSTSSLTQARDLLSTDGSAGAALPRDLAGLAVAAVCSMQPEQGLLSAAMLTRALQAHSASGQTQASVLVIMMAGVLCIPQQLHAASRHPGHPA